MLCSLMQGEAFPLVFRCLFGLCPRRQCQTKGHAVNFNRFDRFNRSSTDACFVWRVLSFSPLGYLPVMAFVRCCFVTWCICIAFVRVVLLPGVLFCCLMHLYCICTCIVLLPGVLFCCLMHLYVCCFVAWCAVLLPDTFVLHLYMCWFVTWCN